MKIIEKEIKDGFLNLFRQRKKERMLQYKFKDEFLESLQNCFDRVEKQNSCCIDGIVHSGILCDEENGKSCCDQSVEFCCQVVDV